jgi:hypothetical protein
MNLPKKSEKEEEEIKYLETENKLFITKDYYDVKETDKDILNWDDDNNNINEDNKADNFFEQMNVVNKKIINQKIVDAYKLVGEVLRTYTSGKLPKAFNILSSTEDWEDLVNITEPFNWTPQAMYNAVIQFSSADSTIGTIFFEKYLVPAIRSDIKKNKKLNINYSYDYKLKYNFKTKAGGYLKQSKTLNYKKSKLINNPEKINNLPNFNRNITRKNTNRNKVNIFNKNKVNILNSIYNEARRYKTLDEIFGEIKNQENKYNNDSYGGINAGLLRGFNKIKDEQKEIKRILGESDDKDLSLGFHNNYLNKIEEKKKDIFRSKSVC